MEAFLSKDVGPQHTLADLIVRKIKENDAVVSSGNRLYAYKHFFSSLIHVLISLPLMFANAEAQPLPKLDTSVIDLYKGYKVCQFC